MTTVKLRHSEHPNKWAIKLGDVSLADIDEWYTQFSRERIIVDGDEYDVLFRDFVVEDGEACLVVGYGNADE